MYAFFGCSLLEKISFPSSLISIGQGCFLACSKLKEVDFGKNSSLKVIGFQSFFACKSLKSLAIPSSVNRIDAMAFMDCDDLEQISIPSSINTANIGLNRNVVVIKSDSELSCEDEKYKNLLLQINSLKEKNESLMAENKSLKDEVISLRSRIHELESNNKNSVDTEKE